MPERTIHVTIGGLVQGVGYRAWVAHAAQQRGLSGWARNRRDGSVEAVFAGSAATVDAMLEACWQGPPMADVRSVVAGEEAEPVESGFRVLPTA